MKIFKKLPVSTVIAFLVFLTVVTFFTLYNGSRESYDNLRGSNDLLGSDLSYYMGDGVKQSWEKPVKLASKFQGVPSFENKMETVNGKGSPTGTQDIWFLEDAKYSPDCCPSVYSNSMGCICASKEVYNYLNERGGNRTLTSEY